MAFGRKKEQAPGEDPATEVQETTQTPADSSETAADGAEPGPPDAQARVDEVPPRVAAEETAAVPDEETASEPSEPEPEPEPEPQAAEAEPVTGGGGGTIRMLDPADRPEPSSDPAPAVPAEAPAPSPAPMPAAPSGGAPGADAGVVEQRPELLVAGAFVGSFLLAKILKRVGGG